MRRKNRFETYKEAASRGNYDEFPMFELGIDPQLHLSRNSVPQPFFLICEQDTVIAQMSGVARIEFRNSPANHFILALGDFVYVPGGTPHRLVPQTESIHLRYKAAQPGLEAVAWYKGDEEVARVAWDCAQELPQDAYLRACRTFNADAKLRQGLPEIDLTPFRWSEVAAEVKEAEAFEAAHSKKSGDERQAISRSSAKAIAPPAEDRIPLKVNVYDYARTATAALSPLFPYFAPGCIVPCIALQDPGARGEMGYFVHYNTVQEVNLCVGSSNTFRVPGGVSVGPTTHPVGQKPDQVEQSNMFYMGVITQRQAVGVPQREAMIFHCDKCGEPLYRRDYAADEFPDPLDGPTDPQIIGLPTISQSSAAAEAFNSSEAMRTCKSCGHVSKPFPTGYWGWDHYRRRTAIAVASRKVLTEVAMQGASASVGAATLTSEAGVASEARAATGVLRFHPVAKTVELGEGEMKPVTIGVKTIALYRLGGDRFYASEAYCTHGHALLTDGYIEGAIVECPMHGGTFEIATGKPVGPPCTSPLATYPVRVEGDTVSIGLSGDA
jgi:nitrite reductase/ring-hydroxylating ferredoxin subunit